jgi:hypothetical protein
MRSYTLRMHAITDPVMSVADAARLAALRRPYGDGQRSYAWFLRRKVAQVSAAKMASELGGVIRKRSGCTKPTR